ncbi:MAG: hypothetical protein BroJett022_06160 [Actinomycetes bacterium]|nr:MAG: hypothetical protein BroJett022_06160 [Actinomycetes bacterium]
MEALRNIDLLVLLVALPTFILLDAPLIAWAVAGAAWVVGRIGMELAARKRRRALAAANRNAALGVTAAAVMGRVWLLALAILLVGLLDERDAGLAAAVLALVLVTAHLGASFVAHLLDPGADGSLR